MKYYKLKKKNQLFNYPSGLNTVNEKSTWESIHKPFKHDIQI